MTAPGDRGDLRTVQAGRRCCRDLPMPRLVGAGRMRNGGYVGKTAVGASVHGVAGRAAAPRTCNGHPAVAENTRGLRRAPQ